MTKFGLLVLLYLGGISSAPTQEALPDSQRTNGAATLAALSPLLKSATASNVLVRGPNGEGVPINGVIMSSDGYVLTQASEAGNAEERQVTFSDGTKLQAREVRKDPALNLLLIHAKVENLPAVAWGVDQSPKIGEWLCTLTRQGKELRLGVMSAKRRAIPDSGAVLGINFGPNEDGDRGILVEEVAEDGPAAKAGLLAGDLMVSLDGEMVGHPNMVKKIVSRHQVGDDVRLGYERKGVTVECGVRLASKSHVLSNWSGEGFGTHGVSVRTDNFPEVLQHDMPLDPNDMGGALYNLSGLAVGLNIARVDRITNFALPADLFLPPVRKWMNDDRHRR